MRTLTTLLIALVLAAAPAACGKKDKEENKEAQPEATPETTPPETPPEEKPTEVSTMPNKQKHCPNAVEGAKTEVADGDGAVVVTVTGEGDAVAQIQERAEHLGSLEDTAPGKVQHTGKGEGGRAGQCPVYVKNAEYSAENIDNGVKVTLKPKAGADLAALKSEVEQRVAKLEAGAEAGEPGEEEAAEGEGEPDE